jgi:Divergent InlB B-repeat domain
VTATFVQDVTLSVNVTGSGTVTSSPTGISCPSTCSASYAPSTQVTLTATPANGYGFSGWGGACSGVGNCVVTMNTAQSVTATFAQTQYTLNVSVAGNGTVTSSPSGISCPSVCTMNYSSGTPVTLTATPAGGATFNGWGGACTGNGSCMVTMNSIESVTAMFSASGGGGPSSQTFVSATLGNDSNPCTRISPCLTFAAALAQTTAGGEIDVIDPGDFGPVTITKAITIFGNAIGGASVAGTTPSPGTSGIVISAGSSDVINLGGLTFDGVNASGTSGVVFTSGARLHIENCAVLGFTTSGITFSPGTGSAATTQLVVQGTTILNNATGILIQPTGGIAASVRLRSLSIDHNAGDGLRVDGTGGTGAINVAIADSTASFNAGNGIDAVSGPGNATVDIMRVVAASNGSAGIQSNQASGGIASVTVGSSMLRSNAIGIQATGGAGLLSYGNNQVTGNASNGSFTGTASFH